MNFDTDRPRPSQLSAEAARPLSRALLAVLLAAFALPGVFGRDLWPEDASAFGRMWTMAHGTLADWWFPNVAGLPTPQDGPFPFWLGAASIRWLGGWLGETAASRISTLIWFAACALFVWGTTRRLAADPEAQPLAPAFGLETEARDYARLLADISVLIFVSTLGILVTLHVTSGDTACVALVAAALYGLAVAREAPVLGPALSGLCVGALALARGPLLAAGMLAGCDVALALALASRPRRWGAIAACSAGALAVAAVWPAVALLGLPHAASLGRLWADSLLAVHPLTRDDGIWLLRNASWYVWPLWPLAAWSLYAWRHHLRAAHIAAPACVLAGLAAGLAVAGPLDESKLVPAIAPLAVLAALGFPTLRRTLAQWFDWFAMSAYTLFVAFVWAYFLALVAGSPRAMATSVSRLITGYTPGASLVPPLLALAVTGLWAALIVWRVRDRPAVLWRGALLSASGMTALWLVAVALFLPAADYNRSYRLLSEEIGRQIPAGECVTAVGVSTSLRAVIAFYGRVRFAHETSGARCRLALQAHYRRSGAAPPPPAPDGSWELIWQGRRPVRADETWRLWRLARSPS